MPSFGETLRRERELRGIDLRDVAEATKISVRFLQALESDRTDVLPGGLFPRAFVRQYASYLGLDPERTVAEYLFASSGQAVEAPPQPSPPPAPRVRRGFVMALLAAGALGFWAWPQGRTAERDQVAPPPTTVAAAPSVLPSLKVYPPPSSTGPSAQQTGGTQQTVGLVLDLQARQSCWVAVQADGVKVMDRVLAEGESQTLSAHDEIVLSVGNAGGLAYKLNGKPGVMLGREGEVRRNIVITRQSVPSLLQDGPLPPA